MVSLLKTIVLHFFVKLGWLSLSCEYALGNSVQLKLTELLAGQMEVGTKKLVATHKNPEQKWPETGSCCDEFPQLKTTSHIDDSRLDLDSLVCQPIMHGKITSSSKK